MSTPTYEFITDPGHGWLKVPLTELNDFKPTEYSFKDGSYAYLEEDCDAPEFLAEYANQGVTIKPVHVDNFNRNRARFDVN